MIKVYKENEELILEYESYYPNANWVYKKIEDDGYVNLNNKNRIFEFKEEHLANKNEIDVFNNEDEVHNITFILGTLHQGFYIIDKDILGLKYDLKIHKDININENLFINKGNSVMSKIDSIINEPIIIGIDKENSILIDDLLRIIKSFPTKIEMMHYERSRIERVLVDYFDSTTKSQEKLDRYLNKRKKVFQTSTTDVLKEYEYTKYKFLYKTLSEMLKKGGYIEKDWQNKILEIILLLYPQYIKVLSNVNIKDYYSNPKKVTNRFLDILLVKANGYVDIIEIKQPFENAVLNKSDYRGNYIPHKELSGAIMQTEKYIFHLNKWGHKGEGVLNKQYSKDFSKDFILKIANPKGIIILGRDKDFNDKQKLDFEVIKRKYANIVDILTYDDLLNRLKNVIDSFKKI